MAVVKIEDLMRSESSADRLRAVVLLARSDLTAALPHLEQFATADPDPQVREAARQCLDRLRAPASVPATDCDTPSSEPRETMPPPLPASSSGLRSRPGGLAEPITGPVTGTSASGRPDPTRAAAESRRTSLSSGMRSAAVRPRSGRLPVARPVEPPPDRRPIVFGFALTLLVALLVRTAMSKPQEPLSIARSAPAAARGPDAARRFRGHVRAVSEDARKLAIQTTEGALEALFSTPVPGVSPGLLVEVEGRLEDAGFGSSGASGRPKRLQARLIKVLESR